MELATTNLVGMLEVAMKKIEALETQYKEIATTPKEPDAGMIALSPAHPSVVVDVQQLRNKLYAPTTLGKINGVYDLVVPREHQGRYSGKGRGGYPMVPSEIFEAMKDFFGKRLSGDPSTMIVEAINQKGAQARHDAKEKTKMKPTQSTPAAEGILRIEGGH